MDKDMEIEERHVGKQKNLYLSYAGVKERANEQGEN